MHALLWLLIHDCSKASYSIVADSSEDVQSDTGLRGTMSIIYAHIHTPTRVSFLSVAVFWVLKIKKMETSYLSAQIIH